jgi:pimeloyl-ACP methyl ester carboxylesterase
LHDSESDPILAQSAAFVSNYLPAAENVELRVYQWTPKQPKTDKPVVFVAGWVSHISGWADLLTAMTAKMPVFYIETREKRSARIHMKKLRKNDFTIQRIARDLISVCRSLPVRMENALLMGSSFGATGLLEGLKNKKLAARGAFLVGPNSEFKVNPLLQQLLFLPSALYHPFKYFVLWYLKTFRVDAKKEPEQMQRYNMTLRAAHPLRIKMSVKAAVGYKIWDNLETVDIPVGLAYATSDTLHPHDNIKRMSAVLPKGKIIPCPTNRYMHSADLMQDIEHFAGDVDG